MPARLSSALTYPIPAPARARSATRLRTVEPSEPRLRPLRVALVTETYPPEANGAAMTVGRLVASLVERGHFVQVVRPRQSRSDRALDAPRVEEVVTRGQALPFDRAMHFGWFETERLRNLWRLGRPDVVHIATEGPLGLSALWAAKRLALPVSTTFHTNFDRYASHYGFGWLNALARWHLRSFHNRTACTLVPTRQTLEDLERHGYRNLRILPRGVDTRLFNPERRSEELRQAWSLAAWDTAVLYVGRMAPEKNLALAIETFEAMRRVERRLRFILVGDGPLRGQIEREHPDYVFAGRRHGEDLAAHYATGDILLFPSLTETFGNVTLEGLASGLTVVAYDDAAARVLIRDQENGLLAERGDKGDFIAHALLAITAPGLAARCGAEAARTAASQSWDVVGALFEKTLFEIVERNLPTRCH